MGPSILNFEDVALQLTFNPYGTRIIHFIIEWNGKHPNPFISTFFVSKADPEAPNQLPLMVALLDDTDFPIDLLHYGLSLLDDELEKPIIHSESQGPF